MSPSPPRHLFALPCLLIVSFAGAQDVKPTTPVAVENTNAAFTPIATQVPIASPARPTVTSPAHIPPVGYLQFEQGFNQANDSPAGTNAQFSLNQVTKIALTTRLLVQFISQPYSYNRTAQPVALTPAATPAPDLTTNAPGDLLLGGQAILHKSVGAVPVVAVGYLHRVRTGTSADLDVGSYSKSAILLFSGDLPHELHYDANVIANEQSSDPVRRAQFAQTLSVSRPLFEKLTEGKLAGVVELSHFTQPLVTASVRGVPIHRANTVELLFSAAYSVRPNLVLDAAFAHGLTSSSTQWQGALGFTYLLPHRLWPDRHPVPQPVGPFRYRNVR